EQQDTDALAQLDKRKRDASHDAGFATGLLPGLSLRRIEDILVDTRLLRAECIPANAFAVDIVRVYRERRHLRQVDRFTGSGNRLQPSRVRLFEKDHGSQ